jgi:hypothetical protein
MFYEIKYFFKYKIKYFFQRHFRGYDNCDIWDLRNYIARKTIKPLKRFRANLRGYPSDLTYRKWQNIIDKMIFSMDWVLNETDYLTTEIEKNSKDKERYINIQNKVDEGFKLFGKYFRNLWD